MSDNDSFPHPVYAETVLAPLFEGVKAHFATHMAAIDQAHLVMLSETGIIGTECSAEIARALVGIEEQLGKVPLTYTGEHEDYFFYVEAELRARLGDVGGRLHTARSRNDIDHTVFKMALRERGEALLTEALSLAEALLEKAEAEQATLIVAYTHGQPAQPSTYGHYLAAVVDILLRDLARLDTAIAALDACPMGAAAITTTGFPIDRGRVAALLGFAAPTTNSYTSIAGVDYITGLYSAMKLIFLHLGRVVQDMAFWSAFEVGQLEVPGSLVQISSIMPQKRNPVPIEHMRHLASASAGRCDMVVNTMHNTSFTDMNDSEGEVQQAGFAAFESGLRMLKLMAAFVPATSINHVRVAKTMDAACITVTELADTLVREEQISFRAAHEIAATVVKASLAAGRGLTTCYREFVAAFETLQGCKTQLSEPQFQSAVDPASFVARRDRPGGPAPSALATAFAAYESDLAALATQQNTRQTRQAAAARARNDAFHSLMED